MANPPRTKPGKLSDQARHVVLPSGLASTGWPAVRDKCAELAIRFDEWQDGAGRAILAKRKDGVYACSIGGAVLSIPRQVGKTFLIGAIVFALCLLRPGLTVIWTAHRLRTAEETFAKMQAMAGRRKIKPLVRKVVLGSGDEAIEFTNGSRILFGARERGFGRGFDKVDVLVFDEAQILTENAIDDMVPATNQSANPLLFFIGTPPKPSDPSEVFTAKRSECLSGEDEDTVYIEFSADRGCDPLDRKQWAKANPSFPKRTNESAMLRMKKNLSADSFVREALGIWDEVVKASPTVFDPDVWAKLALDPPLEGVVSYGVKFSPDGETVAVAGAMRPDVGPIYAEGIHHRSMFEGTKWLVDWFVERPGSLIVVDGRSGAGGFVKALRKAGVPQRLILQPTTDQVITAHSMLQTAVRERQMIHSDDQALTDAVASAGRRPIGTAGGWGLMGIDGADVTLLESVVMAYFGAATSKKRTTKRERRAVVLS